MGQVHGKQPDTEGNNKLYGVSPVPGISGCSVIKSPLINEGATGDLSLIPGLGRSPGEENGNLLQYCCLGNPTDRGTWKATVHGAAKSRTRLSDIALPQFLALWTPGKKHRAKDFFRGLTTPYTPPKCISMCCMLLLSHFSRAQLFATLRTVACQASLSMGFSRQEYWSELPCPPPGDLPNPRNETASLEAPASHTDSSLLSHWGKPQVSYKCISEIVESEEQK